MAEEINVTTIVKMLKTIFDHKPSRDQILNDFPSFGMMKKVNKFYGENYVFSLKGAGGQGAAMDFASAIANASAATYLKPTVTRGQIYGYATMSREAILACNGTDGSFENLSQSVKDDLVTTLRRMLGQQMFGDGGGSYGKLKAGSVVNTNKLYLADKNSHTFFERGQTLQLSSTNGTTGAVEAGTVTVTGVDRTLGVLTLNAVLNTAIPTAANTMWVFIRGNHNTQFGGKIITGMPGWIPKTDPVLGVDSFWGIDRGVDPWRFAGLRYLDGGSTIKETLLLALGLCAHQNANPKVFLMNPLDYAALANSLDNKSDTVRLSAYKADVGYDGVFLRSPTAAGKASILGDASIPIGDCWGVDFDDWEFRTLCSSGEFPELIKNPASGSYLQTIADKDSYGIRYGGFGNTICYKPANQIYVRLPTAA